MSLISKVKKAVENMFVTLKDFQVTASYSQKTIGAYNPDTGGPAITTTTTSIKGIALNYQEYIGSDKSGERSDLAFIYIYSKYPVIPSIGDIITVSSKNYSIITIDQDVAFITYSLQLRAV